MVSKKTKIFASLALLSASVIWGSAFLVMKNTISEMPTFYLLAIRFIFASILLGIVFYKKLRLINKTYLIQGAVLGLLIGIGYIIQTFGLMFTTPGKNAFLTAAYCIIVPFIHWAITKKKPKGYTFLAAVICVLGIGFVSLTSNFTMGKGDLLTLICAFFYASHIVAVSKFSEKNDIILLTILQFVFSGIFCLVLALKFETFPTAMSKSTVLSMAYLTVFSTAIALLCQNVGQKFIAPSSASIILSLESVFGVLFSIIFGFESLTFKIFIGFTLIFIAVIVSSVDFKTKGTNINSFKKLN